MEDLRDKAVSFFKKHSMYYGDIEIEKNCGLFIREMEKGLSGESGSIPMIPSFIDIKRDIPADKPVIVIDAGGTSLRRAVVHFDSGRKAVIEDYRKYPMPGTHGEITGEQFFSDIASYILPVIDKSDTIAFCFSFTAETLPNKDAKIVMLGKEIKIKGIQGEIIGKRLVEALGKKKRVIVLNDSVASLLGGCCADTEPDTFGGHIAIILGTGINTCYLEQCARIVKLNPPVKSGSMIISTESGNYDKFMRGDIDGAFDLKTANPGVFPFEKIVGGKYEGGLFLMILRYATREGLFSKYFAEKISGLSVLPSAEVDRFAASPFGDGILSGCCETSGDSDRNMLCLFIDLFYERSAAFIFINLASIILMTGNRTSPCRPALIVTEGSTYLGSELLREKLKFYIRTYLNGRIGAYCKFKSADNANMIGSAIAGLTN